MITTLRYFSVCIFGLPGHNQALQEITEFALQQQANGVDVTQEDIDDVRDAGRTLEASLDIFCCLLRLRMCDW